MKAAKRITALFLCAVTIFSLFGCKAKEQVLDTIAEINRTEPDPGIDEISFYLPYLRSDSVNPYEAENEMNLNLATLMYDSLFTVSDSFKVSPLMAESYTADGDKITVKLKNVKFSDSTDVTASDVVYSFVSAKRSGWYSQYLKNLSDASAADEMTVVFTLRNANPFEVSNLVFPIIKSDRDDDSQTENKSGLPVGSGRYVFTDDGEKKYLAVNKQRLGGYHPKYNNIGLKDISEISSVPTLFSLGQIDCYTETFSDGQLKKITGNTSKINTTKFTYLGVNSSRRRLSDSRVRRSIALLLDREDIARVAYNGYGIAAATPFSANFYALEGCTIPSLRQNKAAAIELLEEAGYRDVSRLGIRYGNDTSLEMSLIVNKDNEFRLAMARSIQQALSKANIKVNISELSYNSYVYAVEDGNFDLYIGETMLPNSMDLSPFFNVDGALSYGISEECESIQAYNRFETGKCTMQEFLDVFCGELPFIPVAYRQGAAVRSDRIKTSARTTIGEWFLNIDEWTAE